MTYLLDTCIISKLRRIKTHPDTDLSGWIGKHSENSYFLSVVTLGEIQAGIAKLNHEIADQAQARMRLEDWLFGELVPRFQDRILDVTVSVAFTWGKMVGEGKKKGIAVPVADGLIAATAIHHGLIMVTDNLKDFLPLGVEAIRPMA
jgi:predicted nucleic acid-binding protein